MSAFVQLRQFEDALLQRLGGIGEILRFDNRVELLAQRLLKPKTRLTVYRLGNIEAVADILNGDVNSVRACLASPMYRSLLGRLQLPRDLTVLDLGANSGGFPLLLLALGYTIKQLVSVELNPNTAIRLQYNLQANLPLASRWDVSNAAVVGQPGKLKIRLGKGSTGDSIYADTAQTTGVELEVEGRTLDEVISSYFGSTPVDLCKMDIEGAEYEVFECPNHERIRQCRHLVLEIHQTDSGRRDALFERLKQLEFEFVAGPADRRFGVEYCFANRHL